MRKLVTLLSSVSLALAGCGGGSASSGATGGTPTPTPTPSPTPTACSLPSRQSWALATMQEWYLFPETLPSSIDGNAYSTLTAYIDALTATARAQGKDRFFTYVTSIAEENAFFATGASAGFGIRISYDTAASRVFVAESFEGAPAVAAGLERGDELIAIGTSASDMRLVSDIIAASGTAGVPTALGPAEPGVTRVLRIAANGTTREVTVTKANYDLTPVSSRYGARVLNVDGRQIGYLNLRTFISSADAQLRAAFGQFRAQGISEFIIDLRYNGGGLVNTADVFGDLLGGARSRSEIWERSVYRPEKASNNVTHFFAPTSQSVSPTKIAFIGTASTASASEIVINGMLPYLGSNVALVGANTYGKPVGQIAVDRAQCDDRLRVISFAVSNGAGNSNYYAGLAGSVPNTCRAVDDVMHPLGDAQEASVAAAIDFLSGRPCATGSIPAGQTSSAARSGEGRQVLLAPSAPSAAQYQVPGLF